MQEIFDVAVFGGGIIGRLTAWYAGKSGKRTLLLEKNSFDSPQGSSRGYSRAFGEAYADDLYYQISHQSRYLWHSLERETGEKLLHLSGGIDISAGGNLRGNVSKVVSALESRGSSFELLNSVELSRRYPQWKCDSGVLAIYSPDTGILDAERCMKAASIPATARSAFRTCMRRTGSQYHRGTACRPITT